MITYDSWKLASDPEIGEAPVLKVNKPYHIAMADICGVFNERDFETFEQALEVYKRWEFGKASGQVVMMSNTDKAEADGDRWIDGLTEEEREQL
jgi:hypothetical protein